MDRRTYLQQMAAFGLLPFATSWESMKDPIRTRPIPSSNEQLPVVGLGTWRTFDAGNSDSGRDPLKGVLKTLIENGGKVVDSSPMYGRSEKVIGELSTELQLNASLFIATKVWTSGKESGIEQMNNSLSLLKRKQIDLLQVHNLVDWQTHLKTLREWKDQNKIRYIGITHYLESAYDTIEQILKTNTIDFVQINYSILNRKAADRLFPMAQEKKVAVLINRPFQEGALFQYARGKELPPWVKDFDCNSWAQFFLKFILAQPAVTCAIPGTSKPHHMLDNIGAAFGKLPDAKQCEQMIRYFNV